MHIIAHLKIKNLQSWNLLTVNITLKLCSRKKYWHSLHPLPEKSTKVKQLNRLCPWLENQPTMRNHGEKESRKFHSNRMKLILCAWNKFKLPMVPTQYCYNSKIYSWVHVRDGMFPVLGHQQFKVQLYFAKTFNLVTFTTYISVYMP